MAATQYAAIGTLLQRGNGASPEVFTTIAAVSDISGPKRKTDTIDTTSHDTTTGYKSFIGSLKEGGEVTGKLFFDPNDSTHNATSLGLIDLQDSRAVINWQIVFPTSPSRKYTFAGLVIGMDLMAAVAGPLEITLTVKISGKPTLV